MLSLHFWEALKVSCFRNSKMKHSNLKSFNRFELISTFIVKLQNFSALNDSVF